MAARSAPQPHEAAVQTQVAGGALPAHPAQKLSTQGNDSPTSPLPPLEGAADEGGGVAEESAHAHVHVHAHGAARRAPGGGGGEANAQEQDAALPAPSTFCGSFGAPPPPPPCDAESDDDADEGSLGEDDGYRDRRESDDVLDGFMRNWRSDNWNLAVHAGVQVTQSASATTVNAPAADSPAGRLEALLSSTEFKPLAYAIFWRAERPSGASGAGGEAGEVPVLRPCHIASRHVAGVDVNLYLNSCRSSWGFSLGLGMIGRVAWTKKPEWWPDVLRSPSCVFQRQSLCATTGVRWVAAVPTAGGVVEVGGPGVYAEDRDVLSIIVQICGSL